MTNEQREKVADKLQHIGAERLLQIYKSYITHFNPIDEDFCEQYEMLEGEIIKRMKAR